MEPKDGEEEASWRELRNIPKKSESLADVDTAITRKELSPVSDFLSIVRQCEQYIKAHEGTNAFDEIFKLIFAKLFDERANLKNDDSKARFRAGALETPAQVKERTDDLFKQAKERWSGVFAGGEQLGLSEESLAYCVSALQKAYLLKSDSDVLGAAFEVMVNPGMKGDMGQYFTPRHIIKMCVDVLSPKDGQTFFDPACGSGGFLIAGMDTVFKAIEKDRDDANEIIENKKDYATQCVFGMDFDPLIAKVAKAYMLIWGDGRANIAVCDALNQDNWGPDVLAKFTKKAGAKRHLRCFDIIATNPPFAGDISVDDTLSKYDLAYKPMKGGGRKRVNKMSRDKLFIERCITMLNPGGRMAIVLPRGVLKNYNDEYIRRFILKHARVLGTVGLGGDMFKPFTNTKTCVLFLEKRQKALTDLSKAEADKELVFCVTERCGKNKSGVLVRDGNGNVISDFGDITKFLRKHITFST